MEKQLERNSLAVKTETLALLCNILKAFTLRPRPKLFTCLDRYLKVITSFWCF